MLRWLPDWVLYTVVFLVIIFLVFQADEQADAPPAPPGEAMAEGPLLPGPSAFDPEVLVEVGPVTSGVGTAFAVDSAGWWMTARHVVDACQRVGLIVGRNAATPVLEVRVARFADLALLKTAQAPEPLAIDLDETDFRVGQAAFHVGFPQGEPGEAASRLLGREKLIASGRYRLEEPVLAWAELGRTQGLFGTLAGISGGPTFDAQGRVIGVTVAESARRGRIYTAAPSSIGQLLKLNQEAVSPKGEPAGKLSLDNYGPEADRLRRELAVAQIVCVANPA
jgi:S1-C subfamily serine protease